MVISGYAARFDTPDLGGDRFVQGAFVQAIAERRARILIDHDPGLIAGRLIDACEDALGLFVRAELEPQTGERSGLSVGFKTVRARRRDGVREIAEADLWEISLVHFPMHPKCRIEQCTAHPTSKERDDGNGA
ncbi:HK97 family phage prohead protease [Oceaniradius stylonematis]|uniref:HK97 family phage prohead protease n=1 Tax=Oceaniradius stylonematis TaxID=2184161 RepID=UPI00273E8993|nr:HK97 family phage prohead protease [Oceaniradius stylonematis]